MAMIVFGYFNGTSPNPVQNSISWLCSITAIPLESHWKGDWTYWRIGPWETQGWLFFIAGSGIKLACFEKEYPIYAGFFLKWWSLTHQGHPVEIVFDFKLVAFWVCFHEWNCLNFDYNLNLVLEGFIANMSWCQTFALFSRDWDL